MANDKIDKFIDSPLPEEFSNTLDGWQKPAWPEKLNRICQAKETASLWESGDSFRKKLDQTSNPRLKAGLEKALVDWLYNLVRLNVKRGRTFDLREVLKTDRADCLGYAKLFSVLGIHWGLDLGVVEVVIDNRGQAVPHSATLVKRSNGSRQIVDFWYGSRNIRHQRLGLNVKRGGRWRVEDIDFSAINEAEDVSYLPHYAVDAVTLYIRGNRALSEGNIAQAVQRYSDSVRLYPGNSRVYYNRAVAYEKLGDMAKAQADYRRSLRDESAIIRTLAAQPGDVVDLIRLDEENLPEPVQQIYLRRYGFHKSNRMAKGPRHINSHSG